METDNQQKQLGTSDHIKELQHYVAEPVEKEENLPITILLQKSR